MSEIACYQQSWRTTLPSAHVLLHKGFHLRYSNLSQLLHECDWGYCLREEMDAGLYSSVLGDQSGNGGRDDRVHPVLAAPLKRHLIAMRGFTGFTATPNLDDTESADRQGLREQSPTHLSDSEVRRKRQQRDQRSNDCSASTRQIHVRTPIAALKPADQLCHFRKARHREQATTYRTSDVPLD